MKKYSRYEVDKIFIGYLLFIVTYVTIQGILLYLKISKTINWKYIYILMPTWILLAIVLMYIVMFIVFRNIDDYPWDRNGPIE